MKKKLVSMLLCVVMAVSMAVVPAQAAYEPQFTKAADILYDLGLFRGTGTNPDGTPIFDLDKPATRMQGLIMLIRLLGEEEEALAYDASLCPFTDVSGNSAKYAGYAYSKGYTTGTTATTFGNGPLKANAFLTFTLRALGYDDKAGDFTYKNACWKAAGLGIIGGGEYLDQTNAIYRDSCAQIAFNALVTPKKGTDKFLIDFLVADGAVTKKAVNESGLNSTDNMYGKDFNLTLHEAALYGEEMAEKVRAVSAEDKRYYGVDENITWVANPTTKAEFLNNVTCSFLLGDYTINCVKVYDLNTAIKLVEEIHGENLFELGANKPEFFGAFVNSPVQSGFWHNQYEKDGFFQATMDMNFFEASLTRDQIAKQAEQAKKAAYDISSKLHKNGTIKDGMTEMEIAQVYYDYLRGIGVKDGAVGFGAENTGEHMKYDTTYACLVQKSANCLGKAAAFNVLMHIEGISSQGLSCHFIGVEEGNDHILNYVVLDGKEYICDWGNGLPIQTIQEAKSQLEFFESSLKLARANA